MKNELMLKIDQEKPKTENRWYIVRKLITKRWGFLPNKIEWIPLTCAEVGYPRNGRQEPTDIAYFYDDFCASAACLKLK